MGIFDGATLNFSHGRDIATNQGAVILRGENSVFTKINSLADNQGTFEIHDGRDFTTPVLNDASVFDDDTADYLFGGLERDWFILDPLDDVALSRRRNERIN